MRLPNRLAHLLRLRRVLRKRRRDDFRSHGADGVGGEFALPGVFARELVVDRFQGGLDEEVGEAGDPAGGGEKQGVCVSGRGRWGRVGGDVPPGAGGRVLYLDEAALAIISVTFVKFGTGCP